MITQLLQKEVQQFIEQHENDDEKELLLKSKTLFDIPTSIIAWQLKGRKKARTKIPLYYNTKSIVYPPGINLEQSSSEETAVFKASVLSEIVDPKNSLVDLTGGFGIDSFFFSRVFKQIVYVEPDAELIPYAKHNHLQLDARYIEHINSSAEIFLKDLKKSVDCFYIDPSRRASGNQKVFRFTDCEPNIIGLIPRIFGYSNFLLIKAAPLLDLQHGLLELKSVKEVWVVSVKNEVKELLFFCEKDFSGDPMINAINLSSDHEPFTFRFPEERNAQVLFSDPLTYLYEPNASILKAGAFKTIAHRFSFHKLHASTHLYTSEKLIENFPGKVYKITKSTIDPKSTAEQFPEGKANVITRNYPLSPDELKKKFKLKDGGEKFLIGFSGVKQKFLIAAERVS